MKTAIYLFLFVLAFTSCNNEEEYNLPHSDVIESKITQEDVHELLTSLSSINSSSIRSSIESDESFIAESQAESVLAPFKNDGLEMRKQILSYMASEDSSSEDIALVEGLTEEELTEFSIFIHLLSLEQEETHLRNSNTAKSCLYAVSGITLAKQLMSGTSGLLTAKTALSLIKNLGKRYLGYVGVAIMVIEFTDCYYGLSGSGGAAAQS